MYNNNKIYWHAKNWLNRFLFFNEYMNTFYRMAEFECGSGIAYSCWVWLSEDIVYSPRLTWWWTSASASSRWPSTWPVTLPPCGLEYCSTLCRKCHVPCQSLPPWQWSSHPALQASKDITRSIIWEVVILLSEMSTILDFLRHSLNATSRDYYCVHLAGEWGLHAKD